MPRKVVSCARVILCCAVPGLLGCWPIDLGDSSQSEQVLGYSPQQPSADTPPAANNGAAGAPASFDLTESEPNDVWEQADTAEFESNIRISGSIAANARDIDLFFLGSAAANQRIQADLTSNGSDIQLGVFDEEGRVLFHIDPLSATAGPGRIDFVLRESTSALYAMISTRTTAASDRPYSFTVSLEAPTGPAERPAQSVILVFNGAAGVQIGSRKAVDVPAFDIGAINSEFSGYTQQAIQLLMEKVEEDYAGLNVIFYRDNAPSLPTENVTAIYFGTSDTRLLGLADNVDPYNGDRTQSAIIYTDSFALFNQLQPTFEATVQVLANVTSHEVGHLLGLRHAADPEELMDITATARQMMADQYFKTSSLHGSVLALGVQDAPAMLAWSVGGELIPPSAGKLAANQRVIRSLTGNAPDFYIPRSMLMDCGCHGCELAGQ